MLGASDPSVLWYLARGSGLVATLVLTASMVLGVLTSMRWRTGGLTRLAVEWLHRNVSLLAVALVAVHLIAIVLDPFAPVGWLDGFVPFVGSYRPIWLGLGAAAFDLLLVLSVTSLVRHRFGRRTWWWIHRASYLCWPFAIVHGFGTGTDAKLDAALVLNVGCVLAVLAAVAWRVARLRTRRVGARIAAWATLGVLPAAFVVWLAGGPLGTGWAARAGTPARLLAGTGAGVVDSAVRLPSPPFRATFSATVERSVPDAQGLIRVRIVGVLSGSASGTLDVQLTGEQRTTGMTVRGGTIALSDGATTTYRGSIVSARGSTLSATAAASGAAVPAVVHIDVDLDTLGKTSASGTIRVEASGGEAGFR